MKLSDFATDLYKIISYEEQDLELPFSSATVTIIAKRGTEIVIHKWTYTHKGTTHEKKP